MSDFEAPTWVKYAGDLFFLALFLVFLFFVKPAEQIQDEWDDEIEADTVEEPNPLEKMLVSEDNETLSANAGEKAESADSEKI